jgi:hypothetical protein
LLQKGGGKVINDTTMDDTKRRLYNVRLLVIIILIFFLIYVIILGFMIGVRDLQIEEYHELTVNLCYLQNNQSDLMNDILHIKEVSIDDFPKIDCQKIKELKE